MSLDADPLWSQRHGRGPMATPLPLDKALRLFRSVVEEAERNGWLQESFGYSCVDLGDVPGSIGSAPAEAILLDTGRDSVWPVDDRVLSWDLDTLFDMVEYMYRHVSEGDEDTGQFHSYGRCGWHYVDFDPVPARAKYRTQVNRFLERIEDGFELNQDGRIDRLLDPALNDLTDDQGDLVPLPDSDEQLVARAISLFRSRDVQARRDAVRNLADVLEHHRARVKRDFPKKDEAMLFTLANKFWIRHNDAGQSREYDHEAWWEWMFWVFLASIRLLQALEEDGG